ncbi:hypothetical protein [uncultured Tateyamaria sp.]|uniref:hypothetical protein n=1 Tax=uncultured Tateyamaria sp. TaxID=455651 RepID=UPI00262DD2EB|nr:hypothetical protein [uncultured Tateyamaria sp.]
MALDPKISGQSQRPSPLQEAQPETAASGSQMQTRRRRTWQNAQQETSAVQSRQQDASSGSSNNSQNIFGGAGSLSPNASVFAAPSGERVGLESVIDAPDTARTGRSDQTARVISEHSAEGTIYTQADIFGRSMSGTTLSREQIQSQLDRTLWGGKRAENLGDAPQGTGEYPGFVQVPLQVPLSDLAPNASTRTTPPPLSEKAQGLAQILHPTSEPAAEEPQANGVFESVQRSAKAAGNALTQDARETMTIGNDRPIAELLMQPDAGGLGNGNNDYPKSMPEMRQALLDVEQDIDTLGNVAPDLMKRFKKNLETAHNALNALDTARANPSQANKAAVAIATNSVLMTLPWLLATDPTGMKQELKNELLAEGNKNAANAISTLNRKFMLVMSAFQAKSLQVFASEILSPVADWSTMKNLMKDRNAYDAVSFATGALTSFHKPSAKSLLNSTGFSLGRAAAAATTLNVLFQTDAIFSGVNKLRTGAASLIRNGDLSTMTAFPRLESQAASLGPDQKELLNSAAVRLGRITNSIKTVEDHLSENSIQTSPTLRQQLTFIKSAFNTATAEIAHITGLDRPSAGQDDCQGRKVMLAAAGAVVMAMNLVSVLDDGLAMADVIGDAAFSLPILLANAFDPSVNTEAAKDDFKSFIGTSLISGAILGANFIASKIVDDPIETVDALFYSLMPIMAGMSLALPSIGADALVSLLDRAWDSAGNAYARTVGSRQEAGSNDLQTALETGPDSDPLDLSEQGIDPSEGIQTIDMSQSQARNGSAEAVDARANAVVQGLHAVTTALGFLSPTQLGVALNGVGDFFLNALSHVDAAQSN